MKVPARVTALLCALSLGVSLSAQVAAPSAAPTAVGKAMEEALKLRAQIANSVLSGDLLPEEAIARLHTTGAPAGMDIDSDAAFAIAAMDIGMRLIAAHAPAKAENFFRSAEDSLNLLIDRTADGATRDKVQYLQLRAHIRSSYLNKLTEARADLDTALKLTPGDKRLQQMRNLLTADPALTIQNHKELPKG